MSIGACACAKITPMRYSLGSFSLTRSPAIATGSRSGASPSRSSRYDVVIVGGWGPTSARQCRAQHHHRPLQLRTSDENQKFYEWALKLWEGLEPRARLSTSWSRSAACSTCAHPMRSSTSTPSAATACACNGIDAELLGRDAVAKMCPVVDLSKRRASRSSAGFCSRAAARRGTMPSPGGMRAAADRLGVDIIENCAKTWAS